MADQCSKGEWSKDEGSKQEKAIAHRAYEAAYHRECASVLENVRGMATKCDDPTSVWEIQDYLEKMQKKICEKYDFRYYVIKDCKKCGDIRRDMISGAESPAYESFSNDSNKAFTFPEA